MWRLKGQLLGITAIILSIISAFTLAGVVWFSNEPQLGAPAVGIFRTLLPVSSSSDTIGTSTRPWAGGYFNAVYDADGNAYSTSTGAGLGTVSTSSAVSANYFPYWTGDGLLSGTSTIYQSSGSIGIGTTAPSSTLHVVGTLQTTATSTFGGLALFADGSEGNPSIAFSSDPSNGFHLQAAGVIDVNADTQFRVDVGNSSAIYDFQATQLLPAPTNTIALGGTSNYWSDLYLGDGGVINFNNDVTLTHASNMLTLAGGGLDTGGATSLEIPNGAGGTTVDADGECTLDTTSRTFNCDTGAAEQVLGFATSTAKFGIASPSASEDIGFHNAESALTITKASCWNANTAGNTFTFNVYLGTGTNAIFTSNQACTATSTPSVLTINGSSTIASGSLMRFITSAASSSGAIIQLEYVKTP